MMFQMTYLEHEIIKIVGERVTILWQIKKTAKKN